MQTVIYSKPAEIKPGIYLIGFSKTRFEKCKTNIFHRGTMESAQEKIDSYNVRKYKTPAAH